MVTRSTQKGLFFDERIMWEDECYDFTQNYSYECSISTLKRIDSLKQKFCYHSCLNWVGLKTIQHDRSSDSTKIHTKLLLCVFYFTLKLIDSLKQVLLS